MNLVAAPILLALAGSILLFMKGRSRVFSGVAMVASGIEALRLFDILSFKLPVIGAQAALGIAILVGGVVSWLRAGDKLAVTAATVVSIVGLGRVLARYL